MLQLIPSFDEEKLAALSALVGLYDPDLPEEPTINHMNIALPENQGLPFMSLPRPVREAEIVAQIVADAAMPGVEDQDLYRAILWDLSAALRIEQNPQSPVEEMEGLVVQSLLIVAQKGITRDAKRTLADLLEQITTRDGQKAEGQILQLLTTKKATGYWIHLAASVILPAFAIMGRRRLILPRYIEQAESITEDISSVGLMKLGLKDIAHLTAPNYRNLIPVVLFFTAERYLHNNGAGR